MSGYMNPAEFANIAKSEREFWWYRGMQAIVMRMLAHYADGRPVRLGLDAGCGTGYLSLVLQKERGWPMVSLDLSPQGLAYAKKEGSGLPVQGDITALPFRDESFDMIASMDALSHMPRGEEGPAIHEFARVLRLGGLLALRVPAFHALRSRHSAFVGEFQRFRRRQLMKAAETAGLRVLRCTYANALLAPVALVKFRIWEPLMRRPIASGIEGVAPWLDRLLYAPLAFESRWLGSGGSLPVGQSVILLGEKKR
jgi:SAM-dependent methyltransferase